MNIAIYCGSSFGNEKIYEEKAKEIINYLSKKNVSIVYGGSKSGLMGTISNEAIKLNMQIHGVIPKDLANKEILNNNISNIYYVNDIRERKAKMEELSDAFIAIPGGYGTLEEISEVFTSIQIGSHNKPCALYNQNGYYNKLIGFLENCVIEGFIKQEHLDAIIISDDISFIYNSFLKYKAPKSKWELS
ncbi:TIGR00730 family Rossman fold protein [Arcobacter sp. LA11]|uniref:LOG family protein n=1 Tax=Arcobacter sp. LA11 TaxID=1898176 RepID=UPI000933DC6F|nr:TIGR00730 family Rossman fold protein [Arcobacter sp. LA11]